MKRAAASHDECIFWPCQALLPPAPMPTAAHPRAWARAHHATRYTAWHPRRPCQRRTCHAGAWHAARSSATRLYIVCCDIVLVHAVTAEDAPTKPDPLSRRSGTRQRHGIPNLVWRWPCPNHGERAQVVPSTESKLFVEHLFRTSA